MILSLLLSVGCMPVAANLNVSSSIITPVAAPQEDASQQIAAAGEDVAKLLELATAWKGAGKKDEAKAAFLRIIEIDPNHEEARKGLRHHQYDGKWFESYSALSKYRREESKRKAEEGFSRFGDEWVLTDELPFLRLGWVKGSDGKFVDPSIARELEHEKEMLAEGRQLRSEDSSWVHPDDFPKWQEGLWKCGEEWVSLDEANAYHADINHWWRARGEHFEVLSTCNEETTRTARWHADGAFGDLVRICGLQPSGRPQVVVLKSMVEFNAFAAGDQAGGRQAAEVSGFSSLHYAYFADAWYDLASQPPRYLGTGVSYWDTSDQAMAPFGKHSVRHAAGLAYLEAITPSINTLGTAISGGQPPALDAFWAEKPIPRWLFYGAASYVERYYSDPHADDPLQIRRWALSNLTNAGELASLETVFAFELSLDNQEPSTRLILQAGAVVAFMLDGNCGSVIEKHRALKAALKSGADSAAALEGLQKALIDNKDAFEAFCAG